MSQQEARRYAVPTLPLDPLRAGTTLLVTGPRQLATPVAERLALDGRADDEGAIVVSTNTTGGTFVRQCRAQYPDMSLGSVGFVDATGRADIDVETEMRLRSVSSTGDLTGISIALSILHSELSAASYGAIRSSFDSLSLMLLYTNPKTMTRFVHTVCGRIRATNGLGAFVLTPTMHERSVVQVLEHVCDGRVRVAVRDGETKLRAGGLPDQPTDWAAAEQ